MREREMRTLVMKEIAKLHPVRVENIKKLPAGFPDLSTVAGEIELKQRATLPAKLYTPVALKHFTDEQRDFLLRRYSAGGLCWLLLLLSKNWLLFDGHFAAKKVGFVPFEELLEGAAWCSSEPGPAGLCRFLEKYRPLDWASSYHLYKP